jgi:quercetin dioxygenase-like cupin family protein
VEVGARRYVTDVNWVEKLEREGWFVTEWRDEPHTRYGSHTHADDEVRVVLDGSMTIVVDGVSHEVRAGERFDVVGGVEHHAVVGPDGCTYLAGAKR